MPRQQQSGSALGGSEYDERSISVYDYDEVPASGLELSLIHI